MRSLTILASRHSLGTSSNHGSVVRRSTLHQAIFSIRCVKNIRLFRLDGLSYPLPLSGVMENLQGVNPDNALMDGGGAITALGGWVRPNPLMAALNGTVTAELLPLSTAVHLLVLINTKDNSL